MSIKVIMMTATKLLIKDRYRRQMRDLASLDNFVWETGEPFDAQSIIANPNISLYCLDDTRQDAIFAVLPDEVDLSDAPFVYQAQFDYAKSLIAVPYGEFLRLADTLTVDASQLICIHNVGRCGSTLLSQALNQLDTVTALSEPDVFANFVTIRYTPREQQIRLLQASYKFMFRPAVVGDTTRYALKFRNHCADIIDIFAEAFPTAKHIFMYRNGMDWVASLYRIIHKTGRANLRLTLSEAIAQHATYFNRPNDNFTPLFDPATDTFSLSFCRGMLWVQMMNRYVDLYNDGFRPITIRYEDLIANREAMLSEIFERIGLPLSTVAQAQQAFKQDSQAGTSMARDNAKSGNQIELPEADYQTIQSVIVSQPMLKSPDIILSGTLSI